MSDAMSKGSSAIKIQLIGVQGILQAADQDKLHLVRSRFDGLLNAYKDDVEATTMLKFLMAEYSLKQSIKQERLNGSNRRDPTNIH